MFRLLLDGPIFFSHSQGLTKNPWDIFDCDNMIKIKLKLNLTKRNEKKVKKIYALIKILKPFAMENVHVVHIFVVILLNEDDIMSL